jgi:hypothetical protein
MWTRHLDTPTLLSTLWLFEMLNFFARDIHELGRPGMLEQIMSGVVDGVVVTEPLMLVGGIMFEIPILMVVLSRALRRGINRGLNLVAAPLTIAMIVMENLNPDLDNIFFMALQIAALMVIIRVARRWRHESEA